MKNYKVIITGPVGAGKTAAVQSATDTTVLTDACVSDMTNYRKTTTTVAMDYGVLHRADGKNVHIYGTPGQDRFDFMWDILISGADGLIILLDNSRNNPYRDLQHYAESFKTFTRHNNTIIGVTHCDEGKSVALETYRQWARELDISADVFAIDARKKPDIIFLISQLIDLLEDVKPHDSLAPSVLVHAPNKRQILTESMLKNVSELVGVNGVSLNDALGELLYSSTSDPFFNDVIALLAGLAFTLEENTGLQIETITLKSSKEDNIILFVEQEKSLGILVQPKASLAILNQQVEDILQWV